MCRGALIFVFVLLFSGQLAFGAPVDTLTIDSLYKYFVKIRREPDIEKKLALNDSVREIFQRILKTRESFEEPFDTLETIGRITSPDKTFRIINWNIIKPDGTYVYYGFIQYYLKSKDEIVLTELIDSSENIKDPEQQVLQPENWFGALYYDIVPSKDRKKKHYLLLGWDGNDLYTNKKIVEVLTFSSSGKPRFGKNVFVLGKQRKKRVIFEFSYMATMRLVYDKKVDMVVFEHMVPFRSSLKDQKMAYGSDLTFDGLEYEDGKWVLRPNVDVKNSYKIKKKRKKDVSYTF